MESLKCYQCASHTISHIQLSCNHIICSSCLKKQLVINSLATLTPTNFQFNCKCKVGSLLISLSTLLTLFTLNSNGVCPKHSKSYSDYCPKCRLWLCDDCKACFHDEYFGKHTLYDNENNELGKCYIHYEDKESCCKDCKVELCQKCNRQEHLNHIIIPFSAMKKQIEEYKNQLKRKTYNEFNDFIEEKVKAIVLETEESIKEIEENIDSIIIELIKVKNDLIKQEHQRKMNLLKDYMALIRICYAHYYKELNRKETDITLLKFLLKANSELCDVTYNKDNKNFLSLIKKINTTLNELKTTNSQQENNLLQLFSYKFIYCNRETKHQFSQRQMHCESIIKMTKSWVNCLTLLNDGRLASGSGDWAGSSDKTIHIWNHEYKEEFILKGHLDDVLSLVQLKDNRLVSGSLDMSIKIWDLVSRTELFSLKGHQGNIQSLIQLKDGRLASGSGDKTIRLWDLNHKEKDNNIFPYKSLVGHEERVRCLIQLHDERLASGSYDNTIRIWDLLKQKCKFTLKEHVDEVYCLLQLKDSRLASSSKENAIKIWNIASMVLEETITSSHKQCILCLIQLRDGRLVSTSRDKTIKVWKINNTSMKEQFTLEGHSDIVNSVIELNNYCIASCSLDKTIRIWSH